MPEWRVGGNTTAGNHGPIAVGVVTLAARSCQHPQHWGDIVGQEGQRGLSADALRVALGSPGCGDRNGVPLRPAGVLVPSLELAIWLDRYVDTLIRVKAEQQDPRADKEYVDLMVGLSHAAQAFRASDRCEHEMAERRLRSAVALLGNIDLPGIGFLSP